MESQKLQISSTVVDFMLAKNIPVEFDLLRALITALGRGCWWLKARAHYKRKLSMSTTLLVEELQLCCNLKCTYLGISYIEFSSTHF